jgi:predicted GNAT family acetyltransferase
MTTPDDAPVVDVPAEGRLVVRGDDGREAELVYRRQGDRLVLIHTGVPDEWAGRGVGGRLVGAALQRARSEHLTVVPWCPYARHWLRHHHDEAAGVTVDWDTPLPQG